MYCHHFFVKIWFKRIIGRIPLGEKENSNCSRNNIWM